MLLVTVLSFHGGFFGVGINFQPISGAQNPSGLLESSRMLHSKCLAWDRISSFHWVLE